MMAHDRIVYAERKLADAQKEVANAQAYLEWAHGVAQDEIDKANKELVAPGALIAEFGGKLHVSVKRAGVLIERHDRDRSQAGEVRCECGESARWDCLQSSDPIAYRYYHSDSAAERYHLCIVRTVLGSPPCDHWIQVPLKMDLA